MTMTYEEIMSIQVGDEVPGGYSMQINATYIGPGESILDGNGNIAPGGHCVSKWDGVVVLDISYSRQLILIQYPAGNVIRQGYISTGLNSLTKLEFSNLEANFWQNGSTSETVYLSYEGGSVLGSLDPHEKAVFLYKVDKRYNVAYTTSKGPYTKAGFVNYPGGISDQTTQGRCLSGGTGGNSNDIIPGSIVPGGRSYPANAIAQVDLDIRDAQGNSIAGREVSTGDELTVLDVGYTKQLTLVQYPAGSSIRQGYITNNNKYIKYINPNNWYNGSTPEPVLDINGAQIGTINPYESATKLYERNGLIEVVYNTEKGINTKSGFVRYPGTAENVVHVDIPMPNITSAEPINYGTSGKGRALTAYKIGNGRNSFIYNCAIHGWEDNWPADGVELTKIGNQIIEHFEMNSTGDFTLYVIPAANPDGVSEGWTNNGPGRCTIVGGIDCNRDFPVGFTPGGVPRHYTGGNPLNVPESRDLATFIKGVKDNTAGKTYLIDMHGWEQSAIGNPIIGEHFVGKLGLEPKYRYANAGYLIDWANSIGIISALIELPTDTHSHADVVNKNYAGKLIAGLTEILGELPAINHDGWVTQGGYKFYYVNGKALTGLQEIDGHIYYFDGHGAMFRGAQNEATGMPCTFNNDGMLIHSWYKDNNGYWHYYDNDGNQYVLGTYTIDGKEYGFDKNGACYETPGNGAVKNGWITQAGYKFYYVNGKALTGLQEIDGHMYYFDGNGAMFRGAQNEATGMPCTFNNDGMLIHSWYKDNNGYWHYYNNDGNQYVLGTYTIDGKEYGFDKNGACYQKPGQGKSITINSNSGVSDCYIKIAKAAGFNINKSLKQGIIKTFNNSNGVLFEITASVVDQNLFGATVLSVSNGIIINIGENISNLNIPYGKLSLSNIVEILNNGLIEVDFDSSGDITILINSIVGGLKNSQSLKLVLHCVNTDLWKKTLNHIKTNLPDTGLERENFLYMLLMVGLAVSEGVDEIGEVTEDFIEELGEKIEEAIKDDGEALGEVVLKDELQKNLETIQKIIMKDYNETLGSLKKFFIKKICVAADETAPKNIFRRGFGASGTYKDNILIGNKLPENIYNEFSDNALKAKFVEQSEETLTNDWFSELYDSNSEFFEKLGVNKEEVYEELQKLRDMVQHTKDAAIEAGRKLNNYDQPSFAKGWNVENCAEIWAMRNAIILGSKVENIVLRTVNLDDLEYARPCSNCEVTFDNLLKAGKILK